MDTTDLRKRALKTQKGGKKRVAEALIKLICIHINPFKVRLSYLGRIILSHNRERKKIKIQLQLWEFF